MFASLVLNVEILSLFSKISQTGILSLNILFAIISGIIWYKKGKPVFHIRCKRFFKRLYYAVMSDKYLLVLGLAFLFMCGISLFLISFMPIVNPDADAYHVMRSTFWISNGNLNHFFTADTRALVMPINSEILYLWLLIFLKKQLWFGIFSFAGFLLSITSLYGILGNTRISERVKLWTIFILSSLPAVIVQLSGTETDIIIAGLVLSSIYLYWENLKTGKKNELYFSALAYALAIGTKTPALMLVLPVGLWMLWMGYKYLKKDFYKPFVKFIGFGIINFILFASYNYILNLADFGSLFGPEYFVAIHSNLFGIKGAVAGFIKHIFLFFDFTGFKWNDSLGMIILDIKENILESLNLSYISDGINTTLKIDLNRSLIEQCMGLGILGFMLFLPCWIYSMVKPVFSKKNSAKIIGSFGLILLGAIIIMSYKITFMSFNIRFLTSFCIVASPILVYSYSRKNNPVKFIISLFALFGLLLISTHLWGRPFNRVYEYMGQGVSIKQIREYEKCSGMPKQIENPMVIRNQICKVEKNIRKIGKDKRFLYFPSASERLLLIKMLEFEGYKIDFAELENANTINFNNYDIIITRNNEQYVDNKNNSKTSADFKPISGISCNYEPVPESIPLPDRENILFMKYCLTTEQYFKNKGFKKILEIPHTKFEQFKFDYFFYAKNQ
ncbi:glycosyltransferase family 39 protein [bacterium]|nr:glycosyltransferase family 39 protein [bacterium]